MKKKRAFICAMLAVVLTTSLLPLGALAASEEVKYTSYKDIPGVTQQEIDAVEAAKETRDYFVYGCTQTAESFYNESGEIDGFTRIVCEELTRIFGIEFRTQMVEFGELLEGLNDESIDFAGDLTPSEERRQVYHMSSEISARFLGAVYCNAYPRVAHDTSDGPVNYGFWDGAITPALVDEAVQEPFNVFYYDDYDEIERALKEREIDAFIADEAVVLCLESNPLLSVERFYPLIYTPVAITTGNDELAAFVSVIGKYYAANAGKLFSAYYTQGADAYRQKLFIDSLTGEEIEYINQLTGTVITAIGEQDNYPICFYNEAQDEFQGISVDTMNAIATLTGLTFEIETVNFAQEFSERDVLVQRGATILMSMVEDHHVDPVLITTQNAYSKDTFTLISLNDADDIYVNQIEYLRIGVVAASAAYEEMLKKYPDHEGFTVFTYRKDAYDALKNGEIDVFATSSNMLLYARNYLEESEYRINVDFNEEYDIYFGFSQNDAMLCSIFNKALQVVDTGAINESWQLRFFDYNSAMMRRLLPYLVFLVGLLFISLLSLGHFFAKNKKLNVNLEKTVDERTKELALQTEAAQAASHAKGSFLAQMSHEIRTPLNAIVGMAQVAKGNSDNPKVEETVGEILSASKALSEILNNILDMSKIESGKFELVSAPFSLHTAIHEVTGMMKVRCEMEQKSFTVTVPQDDYILIGDMLRLKQVLLNLLSNAIKFTDEGGEICLNIIEKDSSANHVTLDFSVKDTGIGMAGVQVEKLFTPFEQTDVSISSKYGGTGLGLSISQGLVHLMQGEIDVSSVLGEGSAFSFAVTFQRDMLANVQVEHTELPLSLQGKNILIVEDVVINRFIIKELLGVYGASFFEAENGKIALEMIENSDEGFFDFVLMDVQMPQMNGYEATKAIRALEREDTAALPIYAMTANAYNEDIQAALDAGMDGHFSKPIDIEAMVKVLDMYFSR